MAKLLSIGNNRKLGRKVGVFNMLRLVTCPGASPLCKGECAEFFPKKDGSPGNRVIMCYADKAEKMYKAAYAVRKANTEASRKPDFAARMIEEIKAARIHKVRIHEDGDFYSQKYLNMWVEVMKALPDVTFMAYTRSFMLDFTVARALPNFSLFWSTDKSTRLPIPAGKQSYLRCPSEPYPPKGSVTCQHTSPKHYCGTECTTCWNPSSETSVYFDAH